MKRVLVISDLHCGHHAGLTPPDWNPSYSPQAPGYGLYWQRRLNWKFYAEAMAELQPIDVLIVNGDATEGKGEKSGSTEILTADRIEQADMAVAVIEEAKAKMVVMSYGTPYHTGNSEDFENLVANGVNARKIGSHDFLDVNGVILGYRHHVGRSSIPHGRYTAIAREKLWNVLWAEHGEYPKANIIIRSHVHYFAYCGGFGWLGVVTPGLQGYGSKYGTRRVSGTIDFGIVWFDITEKGEISWAWKIQKFRRARRQVIKV